MTQTDSHTRRIDVHLWHRDRWIRQLGVETRTVEIDPDGWGYRTTVAWTDLNGIEIDRRETESLFVAAEPGDVMEAWGHGGRRHPVRHGEKGWPEIWPREPKRVVRVWAWRSIRGGADEWPRVEPAFLPGMKVKIKEQLFGCEPYGIVRGSIVDRHEHGYQRDHDRDRFKVELEYGHGPAILEFRGSSLAFVAASA